MVSLFGSTGDVGYLAGISQELHRAGHRLRMIIPRRVLVDSRSLLESMGLRDLGCADPSSLVGEDLLKARTKHHGIVSAWRWRQRLRQSKLQDVGRTIADLINAEDRPALIIGDVSTALLMAVAVSAGIPYIQFSSMPYAPTRMFFMGRRHPCIGTYPYWNWFRWKSRQFRLSRFVTRQIRKMSQSPGPWPEWHPIARDPVAWDQYYRESLLHLVSASPAVIPQPDDWGSNVRCLGYTPWATQAWAPTPELVDFVESGPPPIYVGFGSFPWVRFLGPRGKQLIVDMAAAAKEFGQRLVFQSAGTAFARMTDLPSNLFCIEHVSHQWLFPRCRAVCCHGGYGTVHAALIAKKPMIVYPYQADQFLLAQRMDQLGISVPYRTTYHTMTAKTFARDLRELLASPKLQQNAEAFGEVIQQEDGPGNHRAAIEDVLQRC